MRSQLPRLETRTWENWEDLPHLTRVSPRHLQVSKAVSFENMVARELWVESLGKIPESDSINVLISTNTWHTDADTFLQIENDGKLLAAPQGIGRLLTMRAGLSGFGPKMWTWELWEMNFEVWPMDWFIALIARASKWFHHEGDVIRWSAWYGDTETMICQTCSQ